MKQTYISDFKDQTFDPKLLDYYMSYFNKYYNGNFEENRGTEVILDLLSLEGVSENWLDLGAGSTTLFWSIPMKQIVNVECNDVTIEALKVLNDFAISKEIPKCYTDILLRYGKKEQQMHRKIDFYHVFNVFKEWPKLSNKYDLITEFGTFGQAKTEEEFINAFMLAERYLTRGGKFIGANWIRKNGKKWKYGTDNNFISTNLIELAAERSNTHLTMLKECPIKGDDFYNAVFVFMLKKL